MWDVNSEKRCGRCDLRLAFLQVIAVELNGDAVTRLEECITRIGGRTVARATLHEAIEQEAVRIDAAGGVLDAGSEAAPIVLGSSSGPLRSGGSVLDGVGTNNTHL